MTTPRVSRSASLHATLAALALSTALGIALGATPSFGEPARGRMARVLGPSASVNPMLKNAPGYYPPADPESMSVVIGRRLNAPPVSTTFRGGTRSLDDLGRAVCRALHHSDRDSLGRLCVTAEEFERVMWREFPQSRPATGLNADDGWLLLRNRNTGGISRALQDHAGRPLRFVRWERGTAPFAYRNFRLHHRLTLVVVNEYGVEERLDIVRSAAERRGAFKLYSMKD